MKRHRARLTCREARGQLSASLDGALGPAEERRLVTHLSACVDCRRERDGLAQTVGLLREAEPIRAPAGFVDRVLAAARPEPWWRRLGRRLFTPVAVKVPLQAAAVALLATGLYVYQETPRDRPDQMAPRDRPVAARAPAPTPEPPPVVKGPEVGTVPESRMMLRSLTLRSGDASPSQTMEAEVARRAEGAGGNPSGAASDSASMTRPLSAATPGGAASGPVEKTTTVTQQPIPLGDAGLLSMGGSTAVGIEGQLSGVSREAGREQVVALVAQVGGAVAAERSVASGTVIDILLPRARYEELSRGLARIGRWTAPALTGSGDPLRVVVKLD